ncbi:MAG: sulfurtransferase TusA family protein [Alphaproteobacteria bacterium]|nr:sulfurtransferase TusA family protein [Alphaproteobacteria bacterium]
MTMLDASGLRCPLPVLKARKALRSMTPGEELTVLATDPGAPNDFRAYCATSGDALVSLTEADGGCTVVIRKAG